MTGIPNWEFAPCPHKGLRDVTSKDLQVAFVCRGDSKTGELFPPVYVPAMRGSFASNGDNIVVTQGQIVLARQLQSPDTIYAIQFGEQKGSLDQGSIRIKYREFNVRDAEPDGAANRSQPVSSQTNRAPAAAGSGR
jgi:hypothetical protein